MSYSTGVLFWDYLAQTQVKYCEASTKHKTRKFSVVKDMECRWDNLLQGKFAKDWRKLNSVHKKNRKPFENRKKQSEKNTRGSGIYIGIQWDQQRRKRKYHSITPRQHKHFIRKSMDGLYLGIINCRDLFTNDDQSIGIKKRRGTRQRRSNKAAKEESQRSDNVVRALHDLQDIAQLSRRTKVLT